MCYGLDEVVRLDYYDLYDFEAEGVDKGYTVNPPYSVLMVRGLAFAGFSVEHI